MNKGENILPEMGSTKGFITIDSDEVKARKEKRKQIRDKIKAKLDPEILVADVLILAITSIIGAYALQKMRQVLKIN